ncbi:hypothetical protein DSO57_1024544 [Entomophthora muscae]|uniref:Uncharacterized protein n=1 Tax=Entomophthora muscae TaxID=34485 RepID=A0ACC2UNA9_9FUNG|nr:hypothetical protein DSO57_1024544 [Entomophthora muscae]
MGIVSCKYRLTEIALPGTLNFFAFLIDPAFSKAIQTFKIYWKNQQRSTFGFRKYIQGISKNEHKHKKIEVIKPTFHELESSSYIHPSNPTSNEVNSGSRTYSSENSTKALPIISEEHVKNSDMTPVNFHGITYSLPPVPASGVLAAIDINFLKSSDDADSNFELNIQETQALDYMKSL